MPGVLPQSYVLRWGLPLNPTLTEELDSLTSELQGSSCLYLFRAEIIDCVLPLPALLCGAEDLKSELHGIMAGF